MDIEAKTETKTIGYTINLSEDDLQHLSKVLGYYVHAVAGTSEGTSDRKVWATCARRAVDQMLDVEPEPEEGGVWIEWTPEQAKLAFDDAVEGSLWDGPQGLPAGTEVEVMFRGGHTASDSAPAGWYWGHDGDESDIVAWRIVSA